MLVKIRNFSAKNKRECFCVLAWVLENKTLPTIPSGSAICDKLFSTFLTINIYMKVKKKNKTSYYKAAIVCKDFPTKRNVPAQANWTD